MRFINANAKYRIRKIVVYAIYIFLLSSLQVSFPDSFGFLGQTADLMFVFVVLSGYFNGFWDGAVVGFVCGLVRDVFSPPAVVGHCIHRCFHALCGRHHRGVVLYEKNAQEHTFFDRCGHIYHSMLQDQRLYPHLRMEPFGRSLFRYLFSAYVHYLFVSAAASAQYDSIGTFAVAY